MRATGGVRSIAIRSSDTVETPAISTPGPQRRRFLQVNRRLSHFPNRRQRIPRTGFFRDPFLLGLDNVEKKLLIRRRRHVFLYMLFVSPVVQRFAGLGVKLLVRPFSDKAVELDMRRVQLGLARFQ